MGWGWGGVRDSLHSGQRTTSVHVQRTTSVHVQRASRMPGEVDQDGPGKGPFMDPHEIGLEN